MASRAEGIGLGELVERRRRQAGAAPQRAGVCVTGIARRYQARRVDLLEALDLAQAQPQRDPVSARRRRLEGAVPIA